MDTFQQSLRDNPISNRQQAVQLLLDLCRPLKKHYNKEGSLLHLGSIGAHYGEKTARMEGWARVLWGLAPLFAGDNSALPDAMRQEISQWASLYRNGVICGTTPSSPGYWGEISDYDQKIVEAAAVAVALSLAPQLLWEPLTNTEKENVHTWLSQINSHCLHSNNWRFFRILTNMAFGRLGFSMDEHCLEDDFGVIEHCYVQDGWYFDGNAGQVDYYIPFAIHFYSLLWVQLAAPGSGRFCTQSYKDTLRQRSIQFAKDFIHWFADDGAEVAFGRSLTYRFAHSAFFSALAFSNTETLPWGVVRHTVLQNLRYWMQFPITDSAGILTVGYGYPNLFMSEFYNAHGSPYWAFKAFLFLALPSDHPFWIKPEEFFPHPDKLLLSVPRMLVTHTNDHVCLYPAEQHSAEKGACSAKYEKFVYSNRFGFSVPHGQTLGGAAMDSTLGASPAGWDFYYTRYGIDACEVREQYTKTSYRLLPTTSVTSWIVPLTSDWHIRIHRIYNLQTIDIADGGFAIPVEDPFVSKVGLLDGKQIPGQEHIQEQDVWTVLPWGGVGIFTVFADFPVRPQMLRTAPNTNVLYNLTAVPTLTARLEPGIHTLVSLVFGNMSPESEAELKKRPSVLVKNGLVSIGNSLCIEFTEQNPPFSFPCV